MTMITLPELLVISSLCALMTLECVLAIRSRSWVQIYRPTLFVAVVLAFYVLFGPIRAILSSGESANFIGTSGTFYRHLEHRPYLFWGWLGALIFYGSLLFGFYIVRPKVKVKRLMFKPNLRKIRLWGHALCWVGFVMFAIVQGPRILLLLNPIAPEHQIIGFASAGGINVGPLDNYFNYAINLLIPGVILQFAVWLRQRKGFWVVLAWFVTANLIYISEAFRYRLLLLTVPILLLWFFYNKRRPMLVGLLIFMITFVGFNGIIGASRTHLRGLALERLDGYTPQQLLQASFEEAGVFFTTSVLIDSVPSKYPFIGIEPIATALAHPLPRSIYLAKPKGEYIKNYTDDIYNVSWHIGVAVLGYAEYYLMFGWISVVLGGVVIGLLLRRLWVWFLWRQYEPLAQSIYLLNASYLYVVISRGHLPQVIMLFMFSVFPLFFIYWCLSARLTDSTNNQ